MNKTDRQRLHFESIAEKYFLARQEERHLLYKGLLWRCFFENKEFLKDCTCVLEPMCGYSEGKYVLEAFLESRIDYHGFDNCEAVIKSLKDMQPQLNVCKMDVTKFEPARKYDMVILIGGLHHVHDFADHVVMKLSESLRSGGYLINFEPTQNNIAIRMIRSLIYRYNSFFDNLTEQDFHLKQLNALYEKNGFEIIDQVYPGLLGYSLYYNPDAFPFLNVGWKGLVRFMFGMDKFFMRTFVGRSLSFATLSLLRKRESF